MTSQEIAWDATARHLAVLAREMDDIHATRGRGGLTVDQGERLTELRRQCRVLGEIRYEIARTAGESS